LFSTNRFQEAVLLLEAKTERHIIVPHFLCSFDILKMGGAVVYNEHVLPICSALFVEDFALFLPYNDHENEMLPVL
jgi:hypothetical protein